MYVAKKGYSKIALVLLILVLFTLSAEASPKVVDYSGISTENISDSKGYLDSYNELIQIDSQIESLIKENTYGERYIYELENELNEKEALLEQLKEKIMSRKTLIESSSLTMQIFRATGDGEKYISEKKVEIELIENDIDNLRNSIKAEKELISSNEKEISSLFSEREKYFGKSMNYFEEDISVVIEELESTTKVVTASTNLMWPLKDYGPRWITSYFGMREVHPITGKKNVMHNGIDIAISFNRWPGSEAFNGAPVYVLAAADGIAYPYETSGGYGNYVIIVHDGFTTLYAHTHENLVKNGEEVKAGQPIAIVGSTGLSTNPHLHFEVWVNGKPTDPLKYLGEYERYHKTN